MCALAVALAAIWAPQVLLAQMDAQEVSSVRLIAETERVHAGQTILLGLHLDMDEGWHTYWDGRNDTGQPPLVRWTLPEGVRIGPMLWPAPSRYVSPGDILDHVYEGRATIVVPVTIQPGLPAGTELPIRAEVEWLVCKDVCLPGVATVATTLRVVPMGNATPLEPTPLDPSSPIGQAVQRLPVPILPADAPQGQPGQDASGSTVPLTLRWQDQAVVVQADGAQALAFYPSARCVWLADPLRDAQAQGPTLTLRLARPEDDLSGASERRLRGVIEVQAESGRSWYAVDFGPDGLRRPESAEWMQHARSRLAGEGPAVPAPPSEDARSQDEGANTPPPARGIDAGGP
ncbi:MAG: hypothetical protein KatS3mg103_0582 [Phycisphaerales bacterium]|nr:MAG: hypothetical protein KatS3mg103_0582 [Phycisphaerales bacterium]